MKPDPFDYIIGRILDMLSGAGLLAALIAAGMYFGDKV